MRRRTDFTVAVRAGRRASTPSLVLHLAGRPGDDSPARFGLIVSGSVGGSVVRHRVARRLRAACAARTEQFSPGDLVVVRALPAAAGTKPGQLTADLDQAISKIHRGQPATTGAAS